MPTLFYRRNFELKTPSELAQSKFTGNKIQPVFSHALFAIGTTAGPRDHRQTEPIMLLCPQALPCTDVMMVKSSKFTETSQNLQHQGEISIWAEELPMICEGIARKRTAQLCDGNVCLSFNTLYFSRHLLKLYAYLYSIHYLNSW